MKRKLLKLSLASSVFSLSAFAMVSCQNKHNTDESETKNPDKAIENNINLAKDNNILSRFALEAEKLVNKNYFKYNEKAEKSLATGESGTNQISGKSVDFTKIKDFRSFTTNDYVYEYIDFDFNSFKKDLLASMDDEYFKEKIKNENISFEYQFHSIRRSDKDITKVILPIKFTRIVNKDKKLKESRLVEFVIDGIKLNASEQKYNKVIELKEKIQSLISEKDLNITIDKAKLAQLENFEANELSIKMLNEIFNINLNEAKKTEINNLLVADKAKYKIFVENIKFIPGAELKYELNIRVGIAQEVEKINNKNVKIGSDFYDISFDLTQSFEIEKVEDAQNKDILIKAALKDDFIIQPINNSIYTIIWEQLKDYQIYAYSKSNLKFESFKLEQKNTSRRNALATWKVTYKDKKYELSKNFGVGEFADLYETSFMLANQNLVQFSVNKLTEANLPKVNANIYSRYGNNLLTGGYDELRGFYLKSNEAPKYLHVGEDYLAPEATALISPFDGELVAGYYVRTEKSHTGIGGVILAKYNVSDLKIAPRLIEKYFSNTDHFYIGYIHLDPTLTLNNSELGISSKEIVVSAGKIIDIAQGISPKNPLKIKKGQKIGFIGNQSNNGGWMSHAHVTVYNPANEIISATGFNHKVRTPYGERVVKYEPETDKKASSYADARVDGVVLKNEAKKYKVDPLTAEVLTKNEGKKKIKIENGERQTLNYSIQEVEANKGIVNPNLIFKLRGDESFYFNVEEYFELEQ
ncbi:MSC_0775 family lipoprotein [Mycoplasmopsis opalescens]|uniref:MSC_0775 family lipoprotein n=1 Tax=Mycoplasmopsis opalescens TaxID=114886 RepID=UPI0004A73CCC|nr:hypothetical protein [Mycoplasmopsis opalescens]